MPTVEVNGTKLNYVEAGDGPPIVFVPAFPFDSRMWESQIDALSDRFRLIAPDMKGFGDSDAPDDRGSYTMDSYADDLAGLLDHLGIGEAIVVGLSMGGYITFSLLRRRPELVRALVLGDTRAEADPPEGVAKRSAQQDTIKAEGTSNLADGMVNALTGQTTRDKKPDAVARIRKLMDSPAQGFVGALEAMKTRVDSTPDLAKIGVPTLVVVGEEDGVTPPDAARKIHEHVRGSRLVVIPEAGHLSNLESPDAFNGALVDWLGDL